LLDSLLQELKSDATGQVSNIVANPQHSQGEQLTQVLHIPIDSKLGAQELLRGGAERMLPTQIVPTCGGGGTGSRPQDAIASILASMNSNGGHTVTTLDGQTIIQTRGGEGQSHISLASPVDYSNQDVVSVVSGLGEERAEMVPLNLATSSQQVSTIQQPQSIQVQGFKRVAQGTPGGGIITKKVIIATINGTQRILTPVSSPQMIAVKSNVGGGTRILTENPISNSPGTPLTIIQQKPMLQAGQVKPMMTSTATASSSLSPQGVKSIDNKTCRWKFENGQICGKVFTKTYNLTVHMRMHQDIRPFPCTICEQTFRQKAHLQRHEATHGIDSTQGRKRRKKSLLDGLNESGLLGDRRQGGRMSESEEEEGGEGGIYRPYHDKRQKFSVGTMKTENDLDLDPMIEPIDGGAGPRKMCPVTVGTNTEITPDVREETFVDELEEDMEPVRYRSSQQVTTMQVEQGVQYCEADLLPQSGQFEQQEVKFVPGGGGHHSIDAPQVAAMQTQVSMSEFMGEEGGQVEMGEEEESEGGKVMKTEMVYTSQGTHYVSDNHEYIEQEQDATHLLTADGSFIDASSNHLVMSDGGLVSLVNCVSESGEQQENVVNIVTSTATNEQGQQIVIIENLDQHSPELQREIMNALLADHSIVPISQ